MSINRRVFLQQLGAAGIVSIGAMTPDFLARAARAADEQRPKPTGGRILVVVELAGGNDGLNTVIPYDDPAYYAARPGIAVAKPAVLTLDEHVGLHPQMRGFKELFDEGLLAVVQGVGYPEPNRSHFRSMDIWHSARPETQSVRDGWLGRALEEWAAKPQAMAGAAMPALAFGTERLPLALVGAKVNVPTVKDLAGYHLQLGGALEVNRKLHRRMMDELADRPAETGSELEFLRRTTVTAFSTAEKLKEVTATYKPAADYPANGLGQKLKTIAQMIAGELGASIYFVSLGGFDTHAQQQPAHQALLAELSSAVRAFFADLKGHDLDERVLLMTFSEFGRRVKENGSLGTDHGAASQMFVVSPAVKAGLCGKHPSLTELEQGDLKFHTDFRAVYAMVLNKWLEFPSEKVLGGRFANVDIL